MRNAKNLYIMLGVFIGISFIIKMILIFKYKNLLTLSSDDLNYIKSAVVFLREGIFVFHNYNEPTVFVMPFYPMFLAAIFKVFGYGLAGFQAVRVVQALLSCVTIIFVFLIGKELFNIKVGLAASFLVSFYLPNIITVGYMLTETLFTTLLCGLIYYSIKFGNNPTSFKFILLGFIWTAATLCRPTIALYPVILLPYLFFYKKLTLAKITKLGTAMGITFIIIMIPWWIRNYQEYDAFIPLAASSGNPMLQGTYVNYKQTPENIVYYKLGRNAYETNKTEVEVARKRISNEFKKDFPGYLRWFTLGKTYCFWSTIFYWKQFFGISYKYVLIYHYFLLLGLLGMVFLVFKNFFKYFIPAAVIAYFNVVHCVYMAFDRYAFPLLPLLAIYSAYLILELGGAIKGSRRALRI